MLLLERECWLVCFIELLDTIYFGEDKPFIFYSLEVNIARGRGGL